LLGFFSEKLFLLTMNNWITDTGYLKKVIISFKKNARVMLYRGTVSEEAPSAKAEPFPLPLKASEVKIAYSGGLWYDHGADILLNAFSKLPHQNIHLYITGLGPMKPMLEGTVKKQNLSNVSIIHLDNDVFREFLTKMDILVVPHRDTPKYSREFPSKILEYMWAGKAIISTALGETRKVLEHGKTAILIEPDNEPALRQALTELITDKEKRERLGLNARKYFDDNFSEEVVKPKLIEYLSNTVNLGK